MKINWWPRVPDDIFTNPYSENLRRVKVDAQQSSFEGNTQFRSFDDCSDQSLYGGTDESIASNEILIYEFTAPNAVNIQTRIVNGWAGGRKYIVFPNDGNETITGGAWVDISDQIYDVNGNLTDSGLSEHPTSQVTIRKRLATGFDSPFKARTGTAYLTDTGAGNKSSGSVYSPESNRAGVASGQTFFLAFFNIDGSNDSEFLFTVAWEEVFPE